MIKEKIWLSLKALKVKAPPKSKINVEYPKHKIHGDYASNISLNLAKKIRQKPMTLAKKLATHLSADPLFSKVTAEKPGFINFHIANKILYSTLQDINKLGPKYGTDYERGAGKRILVEFVSANPTGPLNVVNARAAAFGDSLANILIAQGYYVEREYYINDAGHQIDLLVESVENELNRLDEIQVEELQEGYKGKYITEIAARILEAEGTTIHQLSKRDITQKIRDFSLDILINDQKNTLSLFKVCFDNWISENELREKGSVEDVLAYLSETEKIYDKDGAVWMCSSEFGDSKDRVIMRSDGTVTYIIPDIAYHITKYKRGFDRIIDILGPDHHGHIPKLKAGIEILGYKTSLMQFILLQHVTILMNEEKVKMSKREGKLITLRQLIEEVGTDAARFFFLMRKSNTPLDFDIELAKKRSSENPVYYVQYAHARIASIEKKARSERIRAHDFKPEYLQRLGHDEEFDIIRMLMKYPELIAHISSTYDVNLLTSYLIDLAGEFHKYYQKYKIINKRYKKLSLARLFLCKAVQTVIRNGLTLLGISAPNKM
ncbi:MAG: arginine--tRNA ligase [Candidatus Cloacimonas sp. 4484_140]|nr:MAG: arginine--tRNA ligase [Candidatus Cloacimonas sp. 4484_140]